MINDEEIVLSALYKFKGLELSTQELYSHVKESIIWGNFLKTLDKFHHEGILDQNVDANKISNLGINRYLVLVDQAERTNREAEIKNNDRKINNSSLIINIVLGVFTAVLAVYTFLKDDKIEKQEMQIKELKKQIDSLLSVNKNTLLLNK